MAITQEESKTAPSEEASQTALRKKLDQLALQPAAVPVPGQAVSFEEALEITLREDKELLERLAR